ncbi:MAG: aminofutalosine synthase MqnE, partial [Planctomycetes bacterium]|nr:aminofutalosine synthase MqnE [Planctomycetota bacterium]
MSYAPLETTLANRLIDAAGLGEIRAKVDAGERLSFDDGIALFESTNLAAVGHLAHRVRTRLHGDKAYFNNNLHINYTNVCQYSCKFCAFAAKEG